MVYYMMGKARVGACEILDVSSHGGLPAVSVQWGPWAEVGMAARAGTTESGGYLRLDPTASLQAPAASA